MILQEENELNPEKSQEQEMKMYSQKIVKKIVDGLNDLNMASDRLWKNDLAVDLHKYSLLIDSYQELPQLLDSFLPSLIDPIVQLALHIIKDPTLNIALACLQKQNESKSRQETPAQDKSTVSEHLQVVKKNPLEKIEKEIENYNLKISLLDKLFTVLHHLCKTRGPKVIAKLLSHQVSDLEPCLSFFHYISAIPTYYWAMRYIMLLWISLLCMIPFDFARVQDQKNPVILVERLLIVIDDNLACVGKEYESACFLAIRLLNRKDVCKIYLAPFVQKLVSKTLVATSVFELRGYLQCLAGLFKHGARALLHPLIPLVCPILELVGSPEYLKNTLIRKMVVKLAQRLAMCSMKTRLAPWRYQRGPRNIIGNLMLDPKQKQDQGPEKDTMNQEDSLQETKFNNLDLDDEVFDGIENEETAHLIEHTLSILLDCTGDRDTIVRWISAKGIGRICSRLDFEMADQVVCSVIDIWKRDIYFDSSFAEPIDVSAASDNSWHGVCLSLAELTRRGLLTPTRLESIIPFILCALTFEQRKGTFSLGSNVRDSAAFVVWSIARAYESKVIEPFALSLAKALVVVSITDREITIRRAASAAFQESAGRHGGLFPHGIDIITTADYFAISNRNNCFLGIALEVSKFPVYRAALLSHLLYTRCIHWDKALRILAGACLGKLTRLYPDMDFVRKSIPHLMGQLHESNAHFHGGLIAIGEIIRGLGIDFVFEKEFAEPVCNILSDIDQGLFEGFGSDMVREAACTFIALLSEARFMDKFENKALYLAIVEKWWFILDSTFSRSEPELYEPCALALNHFSNCQPVYEEILAKYLDNTHPACDKYSKRGYSFAISHFTCSLLEANCIKIVDALSKALMFEKNANDYDAEARRNAINSLVSLVSKIPCCLEADTGLLNKLMAIFIIGMSDYSHDSRGDVGSWVREAATRGLFEIHLISKSPKVIISNEIRENMFGLLMMACLEKIDRVREKAGKIWTDIVTDDGIQIPMRKEIHEILSNFLGEKNLKDLNWLSAADVIPVMTNFLYLPKFRESILTGLILNVGGLTESLVRASTDSLSNFISKLPNTGIQGMQSTTPRDILVSFHRIFVAYQGVDRIILPFFETLDIYLSLGFLTLVSEPIAAVEIFNLVKKELFKSGNTRKLLVGIKILTGFASLESNLYFSAIQVLAVKKLVLYLSHPYPIIRINSSESLFLLVSSGLLATLGTEADFTQTENLLLSTKWDDKVEKCKIVKTKIAELLALTD